MARRRRRLRGKAVVAAAVLVVLWALLGGPGLPTGGGSVAPPDAPAETDAVAPAAATGAVVPSESAEPEAPPSRAEWARRVAEVDRLEGFLYRANTAEADGRLGAMLAALDEAAELELGSERLRARRAERRRAAEQTVAAGVAGLFELVASGRVLEARGRLEKLSDPRHAQIESALDAGTDARGWPRWSSDPMPSVSEVSRAADLKKGRSVRLRYRGAWLDGRVVATSGDEITIEVASEAARGYAFVDRTELEPVTPSLIEAHDQVRAALRRGDGMLAALWLSHCHALPGGPGEAATELAAHLR